MTGPTFDKYLQGIEGNYMSEKYGFVYIWRDRKHKRFYVGCHWGHEDDGYICSSRWMRNSYKRRPQDFTRRVISRVYTNKKDLFLEEYRWLSMISDVELGTRYYNMSRVHPNHWSTCHATTESVTERASKQMKAQHADPKFREKYMSSREKIRGKPQSQETREKRRQSMIATMAKKFPEEGRRATRTAQSRRYRHKKAAKKELNS